MLEKLFAWLTAEGAKRIQTIVTERLVQREQSTTYRTGPTIETVETKVEEPASIHERNAKQFLRALMCGVLIGTMAGLIRLACVMSSGESGDALTATLLVDGIGLITMCGAGAIFVLALGSAFDTVRRDRTKMRVFIVQAAIALPLIIVHMLFVGGFGWLAGTKLYHYYQVWDWSDLDAWLIVKTVFFLWLANEVLKSIIKSFFSLAHNPVLFKMPSLLIIGTIVGALYGLLYGGLFSLATVMITLFMFPMYLAVEKKKADSKR